MTTHLAVLNELKALKNLKNIEGMKRFGIHGGDLLGISIPVLRAIAKRLGKDHELALYLYDSGIHEAKILAAFIDDPKMLTQEQMEKWVLQFDSWDVCDQVCGSVFDRSPLGWKKAQEWPHREEEFVRRAGFTLMATLAVHDKKSENKNFEQFFPLIKAYSFDDRNFVKKAVNWALRQIGKRNAELLPLALALAEELKKSLDKTARWIGSDAARELELKRKKLNT